MVLQIRFLTQATCQVHKIKLLGWLSILVPKVTWGLKVNRSIFQLQAGGSTRVHPMFDLGSCPSLIAKRSTWVPPKWFAGQPGKAL
eukprot:1195621-Amphidinium_carterae.1